jgi:hypothetical protein
MSEPTLKSPAEVAERLQRRRTRVLWVQVLLFLFWQTSYWTQRHGQPATVSFEDLRSVDQVKISAFVVWAAALLVLLSVGGGLFRGRQVRALLNDEVTLAHRRMAFHSGYWAVMVACFALYVTSLFEPVALMDAVHVLLTVGVAVPALRFAMLERRSERHG